MTLPTRSQQAGLLILLALPVLGALGWATAPTTGDLKGDSDARSVPTYEAIDSAVKNVFQHLGYQR